MRSLYSKQTLDNPYSSPIFQQRSRLKSLKQLTKTPYQNIDLDDKFSQLNILEILQKKMIKDNQKLQNEEAQRNTEFNKQTIKISKHNAKQQSEKKLINLKKANKLFQYFEEQYKKFIPSQKVERQKVNFCQKHFQEIKIKIKKKVEANLSKMNQSKQNLKKKYLELHEYHDQRKDLQIKFKEQLKSKMAEQKKQKGKASKNENRVQPKQKSLSKSSLVNLRPPSLRQRIYIMEDSINFLKGEISKIQEEIESINTKETSIQEQWTNFLKLFVNCGYYMSNGVDSVIEELKKMNVKLKKQDLIGDILDGNAKNYLLRYYQKFEIKNKSQTNTLVNLLSEKQAKVQRSRIKSNLQIKTLMKDSNLKEIYANTREAMTNLLKNSSFRKSPQNKEDKKLFFPIIQSRKQNIIRSSRANTLVEENQKQQKTPLSLKDQINELQTQQINRINHIYFGSNKEMETKGKLIKRILFGFSVK